MPSDEQSRRRTRSFLEWYAIFFFLLAFFSWAKISSDCGRSTDHQVLCALLDAVLIISGASLGAMMGLYLSKRHDRQDGGS